MRLAELRPGSHLLKDSGNKSAKTPVGSSNHVQSHTATQALTKKDGPKVTTITGSSPGATLANACERLRTPLAKALQMLCGHARSGPEQLDPNTYLPNHVHGNWHEESELSR